MGIADGNIFVHEGDFLTAEKTLSNLNRQQAGKRFGGKDCFINRARAGPIAATNSIFVHSGEMLSGKNKDTFLARQ